MYKVIATHKDFTETLVKMVEGRLKARKICCDHYRANRETLLRVYFCLARSTLEMLFYETESQVILVALQELKVQKVYLDANNLAEKVEKLVVEYMEGGFLPWADEDMAASAIDKLRKISQQQRQRILEEFNAKAP